MKRLLFIALLFVAFDSFSQPLNYTRIANRYRWISGMFDSALYVPRYNGTPSGVRVGENSAIDGAIAIDTANSRAYMYSGGAWVRLANYAEIPAAYTAGDGLLLTASDFKVLTKRSITIDSDSIMLVNDSTATAPYHLYGFNIAGRRGFYRPDTNYIANFSTMVRPLISLTTTGSSGAATYSSVTGVLNVPQYSGGGGTDTAYGNFFNSAFPGSSLPSDLVSVTANTTTVSDALLIRSNGTSGFKTNYLQGTEYTASANYTITTKFRVDTLPCSTCPGLTVGRISTNSTFLLDMGVALRNVDGSNGRLVLYMTNNSIAFNALDSTSTVALAAGNWYRVTVMANANNIQYKIALLDSAASQYQDETDFEESKYDLQYNTLPVNTPGIITNTSKVWISNPGGAYKMTSYNEYHYDLLNSSVVVVGTSISVRNYSNVLQNHYVVKAFTNAPQVKYTILAGGGDRLADFRLRFPELKTIRPQYVIVEGFANDVQSSITTNLRPYLDSIITNGMTPIVFQTGTNTNVDTAIANACIDKNVELIYVFKYMVAGQFVDGLHPTDEGNIFMAKFLRNEAPELFNFTGKVDDNAAFAFQRVYGSTDQDIYTNAPNAGFGGETDPEVGIDVGTSGSMRIQGFQTPTTGAGLEMGYFSPYGFLFSYNRTGAAYADTRIGNQTTEQLILHAAGGITMNQAGADADVIIEGDNNANLFRTDASVDRVGIGTSAPSSLLHVNGELQLGTAGSQIGTLKVSGNTSGTITITPAAAAGTYTLTLPANDGDASQYLQTNGSGVLSWADGSSVSTGEQGQIYQTSNGAVAWKYDTTTLVSFSAGARFAADTALFTDSTLYGSFYLDGNDTLIVTGLKAVMNGGTSDTLGIQVYYNDTINVVGTQMFTTTLPINSTTVGTSPDSDDWTGGAAPFKIPPGNWIWMKSPSVVAGRKPWYLSVSIVGYKKRLN